MYKLDPITLAHKNKNNRETHIYYLKHIMEQAAILKEIVEQSKSLNPLDSASYFACKYVKLIQELPGYVRETCSNRHKTSEKLVDVTPINKKKIVSSMFDARHVLCFLEFVFDMNATSKSKSVKKTKKKEEWKSTRKVFTKIRYIWRPTRRTFTLVRNAYPLTRITATNKVPLREPIPLKVFIQEYVVTKVYTRRPKVPKTNGSNNKPKIAKSVISNKTELGTSQGSNTLVASSSSSSVDLRLSKSSCDLEVGFRKHICFVRNLEGVDLISGSQKTNLYTLSIGDMMASSPICLLHGLVRGLPKLKFVKDHLYLACAMGKSKKQSHKPKSEDTNQEKLYLLYMDICGPMRVASINGKKLNATVMNIRTDNGTDIVNQTLQDYYEQVVISHETLVAQTPQLNSVVERRNCTLVEGARTMLIFAQAPLFLWAEAIATAYTVSEEYSSSDVIPTTGTQTLQSMNALAMQEELNEFENLEVWGTSSCPDKARLVARGNHPEEGIDFEESFAPVARLETVGIFLAFAAHMNMIVYQIDTEESSIWVETLHRCDDLLLSMEYCDPLDTPMVKKSKLDEDPQGKAVDPTHYRGMVGTLMYLTSSRLDLVYAVCLCARYQARPTEKHLHVVKRIFQYLRGSVNQGLWYSKASAIALTAFANAD
ncbi:retrovirus-related pol polyprotein from transposon TNT 1-94 [Tanacetum coccineum]